MKRIQHPWNKWEDYRHNFYGGLDESSCKEKSLETYADLLRDLDKFEAALKIIISQWTYSCEHNLTNRSLNKVAYMGQAACALVYGIPHYISCSGYNLLTDEQKARADEMAQYYVDLWEIDHKEKINVAA